jgi:hypothetical protein
MAYRPSRNIEASIIDYLKPLFLTDWGTDRVEKTFAKIYDIELPSICVRLSDTAHTEIEIGNTATTRTPLILIDIFTTSDGQRLDIKDWLISKLKNGLPYYNYTIVDGIVDTKVQDGRIRIISISDTGIDLNIDKDKLELHDRFRHLLTLSVSLSKVEG